MPYLDLICPRLIWGYFESIFVVCLNFKLHPDEPGKGTLLLMPHATNDALVLKLERAVSLESPSGKTAQPGTKVCGSERQRWAR